MGFCKVREILSEPPRGADWVALTGGVSNDGYQGRDLPPRKKTAMNQENTKKLTNKPRPHSLSAPRFPRYQDPLLISTNNSTLHRKAPANHMRMTVKATLSKIPFTGCKISNSIPTELVLDRKFKTILQDRTSNKFTQANLHRRIKSWRSYRGRVLRVDKQPRTSPSKLPTRHNAKSLSM